ncbi:hypothetical protein Tco_0287501 [Tanacetum coccineum]
MGCQGGGYKILEMSKHNVHFISKVQVEVTIVETTNTSGAMIVMIVVENEMTMIGWCGCGGDVDVVFNSAFRGVGDEEVVVGEDVVVTSLSLDMLTNSYLGGVMVSLIFLEGLDEEALVKFMVEWCKED